MEPSTIHYNTPVDSFSYSEDELGFIQEVERKREAKAQDPLPATTEKKTKSTWKKCFCGT